MDTVIDSSHKGTVMRKTFPCRDIFMVAICWYAIVGLLDRRTIALSDISYFVGSPSGII